MERSLNKFLVTINNLDSSQEYQVIYIVSIIKTINYKQTLVQRDEKDKP